MSFFDSEVTFSIFRSGNWVKNHLGEISYHGGENTSIDCYPDEFFTKLHLDEVYGQKIWYKLPFEDSKERKFLCNGDHGQSFRNMVEAAKWCGIVEVFMVNEAEHPADQESHEPFDEELRVEKNVLGLIDDDPELDYHNTPPNYDGEEESQKLVRCKKGSGDLKMNQVFDNLEEFRDALVDYSLKKGWNIKQNIWRKIKSGAICGIEDGCPWRIYCSYKEHIGKWKVKTFEDVHSCLKDGKSKILKKAVIAMLFMDDIRTDPDYKPKTMQQQIQQRQNKESTVELDTVIDDAGNEIFRRFYICFEVLKKTWSMWCRPIFGVDGCFMKCTLKGQLLAAVGRDANNGVYPFAWAVVDVENEENWTCFFRKLRLISIYKKIKGLLNAVDREFPHIEHRMCARHIYGNLKKMFPNQSDMKILFMRVAESYTLPEYNANLEKVKNYDMRLYEAMMEKNPQNCNLVFFSAAASCVDIQNNISESFNNAIDPAMYMPMVQMLETIRRRTMVRRPEVKGSSKPSRKLKYCMMIPCSNDKDEVRESSVSYNVNMRLRTCACRIWDMSGLPCRHVVRVIAERNLNHEDHISHWFLNSRQKQIYSCSIRPVNGMLFWVKTGSKVLPPASLVEEIENRVGRKPKPKRKKARHESPTKKEGL